MTESVTATTGRTKAARRRAPDRDTASDSRNLLLFSDGTGNSSAKAQKTNVLRFYEALDLGYPVRSKQCVQLAYYDNGVGTSAFRLFAILGGVFGFGLARNIRDIYKFACRNYRDAARNADGLDDRIYAFGFSRGAYTIRLLVAMIAATGLAAYSTERQLDRDARDLWREFRRDFHTNNPFTDLLVAIGRAMMRLYYRATRSEVWLHGLNRLLARLKVPAPRWLGAGQPYAPAVPTARRRPWWGREWWNHWKPWFRSWSPGSNDAPRSGSAAALPDCGPEIAFLGVWDTVAAYGGPIVEITRAIDEWIWPLTMPDYRLSPKVRTARHALAIDDKRDSFQPLLWDEVVEAELERDGLIPRQKADKLRLQQVWFAGMHSDVGGGYDDDSLAYVSLWWMIEHAEAADPHADPHTRLRLLPDLRERIDLYRNVYGPIHDSRGGASAFYRYQPRYINAWVDNPGHMQPATQIHRDPTIAAGAYRDRGLLREPIRLHVSVEERLRMATDGYAPNNLPDKYTVDKGIEGSHAPTTAPAARAYLSALGNRIKLRRFWYFVTIALLILLALKPAWNDIGLARLSGIVDDRTNARLVASAINSVMPEFLADWTQAFASDIFRSLLLVLLILGTTWLGVNHERSMIDLSRAMWRARFTGDDPPPISLRGMRHVTHAVARWFHRNNALQAVLAYWKWRALPFALGLVMWLGVIYIALATVTQVWLARVESLPKTCVPAPGDTPSASAPGGMTVSIDAVCADLNTTIRKGKAYRVVIRPPLDHQPMAWKDSDQNATLGRWAPSGTQSWSEATVAAAVPPLSRYFRRVITAQLMTPVLEIRSRPGKSEWRKTFEVESIHVVVPQLKRIETERGPAWYGVFKAPTDQDSLYEESVPEGGRGARLYAFVNDAVFPFDRQAPRSDDCPRLTIGVQLFNLCDRYRRNRGAYRIEVSEQPGTLLDTVVDQWFEVDRGG